MRSWTIPDQWAETGKKAPAVKTKPIEMQVRSMRRQALRRSGGFIQIDNVFAELDGAWDEDFDPRTSQH